MPRLLDNWLQAYLAYTYSSESPEDYHRWVALGVLAGAIRRKVWFNYAYFSLYPNLYTVLVGPAGCKKTTAIRTGKNFLQQVTGVKFTTDSVSREKLIQDMSQAHADGQSALTAFSGEFHSMLTTSGTDMVVFLTDIYECPPMWEHSTKMGGKNTIKAPFLNLLAATTPEDLSFVISNHTLGMGMTSRIVFVFQDTPRVRGWREQLSPAQIEIGDALAQDLIAISTLCGEYHISPEADAYYDAWYRSHLINPNPSGDLKLAAYFARKPYHIIKVAMLLAAAQREELMIELPDIQSAMGILERTELTMGQTFAGIGSSPLAFTYEQVRKVIEKRPGVKFVTLIKMFATSARRDELSELLDVLVVTGQVRKESANGGNEGPSFYPISGEHNATMDSSTNDPSGGGGDSSMGD